MHKAYINFFQTAFNSPVLPYPYQEKLALETWPDTLDIGTGLGKTAAVTLAWLFKRNQHDPKTPRRLVYCLPQRGLVEQTAGNITQWLENLISAAYISSENAPSVFTLMGGHIDKDWDWYPENDIIIIGTQDQLLSRALNRGYAMSRFRWPVQFGLLNNDCLWVLDEVQLMGVGLTTSTQLDAFRKSIGTCLSCHSLWMSATIQPEWLASVDFAKDINKLNQLTLSSEDLANPTVSKLINASKRLSKADCEAFIINSVAKFILDHHKPASKTIVVVNTVKRAQEIYCKLLHMISSQPKKPVSCLLHSRFRPSDRKNSMDLLLRKPGSTGIICISTQVVEAGIDVSARTLITDLAPWPSLIQRFGRCNRSGEYADASVFWLDIMSSAKKEPAPYQPASLIEAAQHLNQLEGKSVCKTSLPPVSQIDEPMHVLRRKDIIDLFDTTHDLSGMDIDISRFIREGDDKTVQVFWREMGKGESLHDLAPIREELCSAPIRDLEGFNCLTWDHLNEVWSAPLTILPGMVIMLRRDEGGYCSELGWTGTHDDIPQALPIGSAIPEGDSDDYYAETNWETLQDHTKKVVDKINSILTTVKLPKTLADELKTAGLWHDAGKAHKIALDALAGEPSGADRTKIWAKTVHKNVQYSRRGFRHELASALALLENGHSDLAAYLAASHHGKVRLSIRSFPHESKPDDGRRFARGIWENDILSETLLGKNEVMPTTKLTLAYMEMGESDRGDSWLSRTLRLRDNPEIGPFRLAFLEALLRCSDWRGSKEGVTDDN